MLTRVIPSRLLPEVVCMLCFARSLAGMLFFYVLLDLTWTKLYACAFLCGGSIFVSRTHMHAADRQTLRHTCTDSTDYYIYS